MTPDKIVEALQAEVVQLFSEVDATTYRALEKLAELDALGDGFGYGYHSLAHWVSFRCGLSVGAAREHLRVARALRELPLFAQAMKDGWLSYSKVRAMTRIATPEREQSLLTMAATCTAKQMEKLVRKVDGVTRVMAGKQLEARHVSISFDEHGMCVVRALLMPDEGARLLSALAAQKEDSQADAFMAALSGTHTSEVVVHVDAEADGCCHVTTPRGDDIGVSAATAQRLACDASVVLMKHDQHGNPLNVGRKTRKISPALKRALAARDSGCRYPGCPNQLVDAHHIQHWADGGETKLSNLVQLCRFHHMQLHEGGYTIENGQFKNQHGQVVASAAPLTFAKGLPLKVTPWSGVDWTWREFDYGLAGSGLLSTPGPQK